MEYRRNKRSIRGQSTLSVRSTAMPHSCEAAASYYKYANCSHNSLYSNKEPCFYKRLGFLWD
jgi:hypothetical protein